MELIVLQKYLNKRLKLNSCQYVNYRNEIKDTRVDYEFDLIFGICLSLP